MDFYNLILSGPPCLLYLLTAAPESTDPSTWQTPAVQGYAPTPAVLQALEQQGPGNGIFFRIAASVTAPAGVGSFGAGWVAVTAGGVAICWAAFNGTYFFFSNVPQMVKIRGQLNPVM
jgi:hypothetical protein